jgi:hypothetical protein
MKILGEAYNILRKERKMFLLCCAFYWGLFGIGMLWGFLNPSIPTEITKQLSKEFPSVLPALTHAYESGNAP